VVNTFCPGGETACLMIETSCPVIPTKCPETPTACKTVETVCPACAGGMAQMRKVRPASAIAPTILTKIPTFTTKAPRPSL